MALSPPGRLAASTYTIILYLSDLHRSRKTTFVAVADERHSHLHSARHRKESRVCPPHMGCDHIVHIPRTGSDVSAFIGDLYVNIGFAQIFDNLFISLYNGNTGHRRMHALNAGAVGIKHIIWKYHPSGSVRWMNCILRDTQPSPKTPLSDRRTMSSLVSSWTLCCGVCCCWVKCMLHVWVIQHRATSLSVHIAQKI